MEDSSAAEMEIHGAQNPLFFTSTAFMSLISMYQKLTSLLTFVETLVQQSLSINEFLKPAEAGRYHGAGGRGRGRGGRGSRGAFAEGNINNVAAPSIEDPGQFPTLGAR